MDNDFIALSPQMKEIRKLIALVRGINVHTFVTGDVGVGKTFVAKMILPNAIVVCGDKPEEVFEAIKSFDEVIIEDFDKLPNGNLPFLEGKKIVATSKKQIKDTTLDRLFGIKIEIPSLAERKADIEPLKEYFLDRAKKDLNVDSKIDISAVATDITQNCHSLKRASYQALLCNNITREQLGAIMQEYFYSHIDETEENYKLFLDVFDSAIINANHRKYKSQLMMSLKMGINRNTLRKKIMQLAKRLEGE